MRARDVKSHARYTMGGDAVAEAHVDQDLARLATGIDSELGDALSALLLFGPFARGEGHVLLRDGEPHADAPGYLLIAVLKRRPERYTRALATISATWTRLLRTRVMLCGVSPEQLASPPATRSWFHAGAGQVVTLSGDPMAASRIPRCEPTRLRPDEFAYALCEGLTALALAELEAVDAIEPLARALRVAALACGDALLLRRGLYAPTVQARADALAAAQAPAALRALYAAAIEPLPGAGAGTAPGSRGGASWPPARDAIEAGRRSLAHVLLDLEAERAGTPRDVLGYVSSGEPLLPVPGRHDGAGVRAFALGRRLIGGEPPRHPLDKLLRVSVALALGPHVPACRAHAARLLVAGTRTPPATDSRTLAARLNALAAECLVDPPAHPFGGWMLHPLAA